MVIIILKPLVIVGAGGLGREVAWLVNDINKAKNEWDFIGFLDDGITDKNTVEGYDIIGDFDSLAAIKINPWVVVAIANSSIRMRLIERIDDAGFKIATLIHPSVIKSEYVEIGIGSIICASTVITTNVIIGKSCIVNPHCFIGHDTVLNDFVSLMPNVNVAGEVLLGEGVYMGINSSIINRKTIGEWSTIGAGAAVVDDIPAHVTAVGVPARVIKRH